MLFFCCKIDPELKNGDFKCFDWLCAQDYKHQIHDAFGFGVTRWNPFFQLGSSQPTPTTRDKSRSTYPLNPKSRLVTKTNESRIGSRRCAEKGLIAVIDDRVIWLQPPSRGVHQQFQLHHFDIHRRNVMGCMHDLFILDPSQPINKNPLDVVCRLGVDQRRLSF